MPASGRAAGRRERAARVGAPILVPSALALLAAVLLWAFWGRIARLGADAFSTRSPEAQVREALLHQPTARLDDVYGFRAGGTAELGGIRYGDVAVRVEDGRARVLAMVQAEGSVAWRDERARLGYVGREAFGMTPCPIALWCGDGRQFANLRAVLAVLFRRADAIRAGDAGAWTALLSDRYEGEGGRAAAAAAIARELAARPRPDVRIVAWQIRVERGGAEVGEDDEVRLPGLAPSRRRARLDLRLEGDRWRIVSGP